LRRVLNPTTQILVPDDWNLISARVNVLLIGESRTTKALVDIARRHTAEPLINLRCANELYLPTIRDGDTAFLVDVDELVLLDQQRLNTWLDSTPRPRLISTSRVSLIAMVEAGMFLESLYYRLNTLCFDVTGADRA
jgi:hypothetical protein